MATMEERIQEAASERLDEAKQLAVSWVNGNRTWVLERIEEAGAENAPECAALAAATMDALTYTGRPKDAHEIAVALVRRVSEGVA